MRLWSLHPVLLDRIGLVALWREALLAQAVLTERTRGYRQHPQLERFREHEAPQDAIGAYLTAVHVEATARGFRFDAAKIDRVSGAAPVAHIAVTEGQLDFERAHLLTKLEVRAPEDAGRVRSLPLTAHPLLRIGPGGVATWERGATRGPAVTHTAPVR